MFNESIKTGKFNAKSSPIPSIKKRLNLFLTAYPNDLITSLRLKNKEELQLFLPLIQASSSIKHLDLSYSNLKVNLNEFDLNLVETLRASSQTLESINFSGNDLDGDFLKKFTLPQRLNVVNFKRLKSINLSFNPNLNFSNELTSTLKKFESLKEIILSKTQLKDQTKKSFNDFCICSCDTNVIDKVHCQNLGWIEKLSVDDLIVDGPKNLLNSSEGI